MNDGEPKERKSIINMSTEELNRGDWRNDPELVAEYEELMGSLKRAAVSVIESLSDDDRAELEQDIKDGTYEYRRDLIRAEGEM